MAKIPYPLRLDEDKVIKPLKEIAEKINRKPANVIDTLLMVFIEKFNKGEITEPALVDLVKKSDKKV